MKRNYKLILHQIRRSIILMKKCKTTTQDKPIRMMMTKSRMKILCLFKKVFVLFFDILPSFLTPFRTNIVPKIEDLMRPRDDAFRKYVVIDKRTKKQQESTQFVMSPFWTRFRAVFNKDLSLLVSDFLIFFVYFFIEFNATIVQMNAIYAILNFFFSIGLPTFKHFLQTYFEFEIDCYFICMDHNPPILFRCSKKHVSFHCDTCKKKLTESFYFSGICEYLKKMFQYESFVENLKFYQSYISENNKLGDVFDGEVYKQLRARYFPKHFPNQINLIAFFSSDGTDAYKDSFWPFFISIMNVSKSLRRNLEYNPICAIISKNAPTHVFDAALSLLVDDFLVLTNGIQIGTYTVKLFLLGIIADLPGRAKILLQKKFSGEFSCCFCNEQGQGTPVGLRFPHRKSTMRTKTEILKDIFYKRHGFEQGYCHFFKLSYFSPHMFVILDSMHCLLLGIGWFLLSSLTNTGTPFTILDETHFTFLFSMLSRFKLPYNYHRKLATFFSGKAIEILLIFLYCSEFFTFIGPDYSYLCKSFNKILQLTFQKTISMSDIAEMEFEIDRFSKKFLEMFTLAHMTHNIHLLSHLPRDVLLYGPPSNHSMFKFEGFNHTLKSTLKTTQNYEKRLFSDYSLHYNVLASLKHRIVKQPILKVLLDKLESLKRKDNKGVLFQGVYIGHKRKKNSSYVQLKNGEIGQLELENGKLNFLKRGATNTVSISLDDCSHPLIKSWRITKQEDVFYKEAIFHKITPISESL